jgi:hypothetical protein
MKRVDCDMKVFLGAQYFHPGQQMMGEKIVD